MKTVIVSIILLLGTAATRVNGQDIYYPPVQGEWEEVDPVELGWCMDQLPVLIDFLEANDTKAFIVLKDGRIAIEHYFGTFTTDSSWYWASAGKSLTAFLVGQAQQEGFLDIDDATSDHLGTGWTSLSPAQEEAITIRHQLSMTTGLDDGTGDLDCTDPTCLTYLAAPGTRWSYHNAPYTLLDGVLSQATGQSLNGFLFTRLTQPTGISGLYLGIGPYLNVFFSRARSMARFGLLMQGEGSWEGALVWSDPAYFNAMITPSQELNEAYGYLWWLNGQGSFMLPQSQLVFTGPIMPDAPLDAYNALGRDAQILNVVPSKGLVVVRMGGPPDGILPIAPVFNNTIWQYLNAVICTGTGTFAEHGPDEPGMHLFPNPGNDMVEVDLSLEGDKELVITDQLGRIIATQRSGARHITLNISGLAPGSYMLRVTSVTGTTAAGFVKE